MHDYRLSHVSDAVLLRDLAALVTQDRFTTAKLLAHIAEMDARKLYVPAGYPSMFAYCVEELRLSEDAAYKRIQAARAARRFPVLFTAMAEGRLHLAGVCLLVPHFTEENVEELIEAATHRRKSEIEVWLVRRFGSPEPRAMIRAVTPAAPEVAPGQVGSDVFGQGNELAPGQAGTDGAARNGELAPGRVETGVRGDELAPGQAEVPKPEPLPERYLIQVTVDKSTHDKLRHAQALLSHAVPGGNVAKVFDRALDALITQLEKRKLGAAKRPASETARPRSSRSSRELRVRGGNPRGVDFGGSPRGVDRGRATDDTSRRESQTPLLKPRKRHVPAPIRRAVWDRDQGQCTFVSANGTRCRSRQFLEYDHIEPVARGGQATLSGLRLRCRAHNQYEAERTFGAGFMARKREGVRQAR